MKIAIEAQRIFRPNKHGMDFVVLETVRIYSIAQAILLLCVFKFL